MVLTFSNDGEESVSTRLGALHRRLESTFLALKVQREGHEPAVPVFALEHGLSRPELDELKGLVNDAVRRNAIQRDDWLPFVVYAAEVGYEYSGDEYWQTFEARTPGWVHYGDRQYIRRMFNRFKDRFGGAKPVGRWADQFSIICWPITHAVLPTDLQRHLARLLFEYRTALTSEVLANPAELGRRLATRAWQFPSRFQIFAQNTDLLGQVAAALLVGDDHESPFLLSSTLHRIAEDLSRERESRRWLRDAKSTAIRIQIRGLVPKRQTPSRPRSGDNRARLPSASDPVLSLRRGSGDWSVYLETADLSALAERLPHVHSEVGGLRSRINGLDGPPLARGRLLFPGQLIRLSRWPEPPDPLISLENGSKEVNDLLADQCVLSPGPVWVFRIRDPAAAFEVRGKVVRPNHEYVVLTRNAFLADLPNWVSEITVETTGVRGVEMRVPSVVSPEDRSFLERIGLGAILNVDVRPVGLVPASWDGEGAAEWIAGDSPTVGVSSMMRPSHCLLTLDGDEHLVRWPDLDQEIFVQLSDLEVGRHELEVSIIPRDATESGAHGSLAIVIRPPLARPSSGSMREGFVMVPSPANPTLTEMWDGSALVELHGPSGVPVNVDLCLKDGQNRQLARDQATTVVLPVDKNAWRDLFARFRESEDVYRCYDEAESCLVTVSEPNLGSLSLHAEREFSALRWAGGADASGPFVRLVDNTAGGQLQTAYSPFATPTVTKRLDLGSEPCVRLEDGGLILARTESSRASVILPPNIRNLADLQRINVPPLVKAEARTIAGVRTLIRLASLWANASLPANPFGANRRDAVLRAITCALGGAIGGRDWERIERLVAGQKDHLDLTVLKAGLGDGDYYRALGRDLSRYAEHFGRISAEKRASLLAIALASNSKQSWMHASNVRLAEFLLRLSGEPWSLVSWTETELESKIQQALDRPILMRAARFVVLVANEAQVNTGAGSRQGGKAWS